MRCRSPNLTDAAGTDAYPGPPLVFERVPWHHDVRTLMVGTPQAKIRGLKPRLAPCRQTPPSGTEGVLPASGMRWCRPTRSLAMRQQASPLATDVRSGTASHLRSFASYCARRTLSSAASGVRASPRRSSAATHCSTAPSSANARRHRVAHPAPVPTRHGFLSAAQATLLEGHKGQRQKGRALRYCAW